MDTLLDTFEALLPHYPAPSAPHRLKDPRQVPPQALTDIEVRGTWMDDPEVCPPAGLIMGTTTSSPAAPRRMAVLVNDFGSLNIDARLVVAVDENQMALSNGCICCTIREDPAGALLRLLHNDPAPEHVVIEASGISSP